MKRIFGLLLAVLLVWPLKALSGEIVPRSSSPNGKFALAFEPAVTDRSEDSPKMWFINRHSHKHISAQLVPASSEITDAMKPVWSRRLMYEVLGYAIEDTREKRPTAFNYDIRWARNSRRVTISAGAHKFSWSISFALTHGEFRFIKEGG